MDNALGKPGHGRCRNRKLDGGQKRIAAAVVRFPLTIRQNPGAELEFAADADFGFLSVGQFPSMVKECEVLVSGIFSRPTYEALAIDPVGRSHLVVADHVFSAGPVLLLNSANRRIR